MRSELEVDLAHPETADPLVTHRSVLEELGALQHLVDDLLQLARSADGTLPLQEEMVDLDDLVLEEARLMRAAGGIEIRTADVSAAQVRGDRQQLARVVRNLCDNALRHAASRVELGAYEHDGYVVVTVTDDGPGIPPSERERIFERFARLDAARDQSSGGTGLGLAIARDVVRRHHGTITVEAPDGGGVRFVVTLPVEGVHDGGP
jgi:signal transduction histidine kinase